MFDLGSYWPAPDNFAGGGGYTESLACSQFLVSKVYLIRVLSFIEDLRFNVG